MTTNAYAKDGAIKVGLGHFSGTKNVFTRDRSSLAAIVRDLLIQAAQTKVWGASITSLTDNSTGTASAEQFTVANLPALPANTVTGTLGEGQSAFTTSLGKIKNASQTLMTALNGVRKYLGLPLLSYAEGTNTANTIPAQDLTGTGAAVGSTVDWATAQNAANTVENNLICLTMALNEILVALGQPKVVSNLRSAAGASYPFNVLTVLPSVGTSGAGASSVLVSDATNFLQASANAFATLAAAFNAFVPGPQNIALTDSTGGTAAAALAANALPAAVPGAATTSAPKAGFDTQLGVIRNAISSLAATYNKLVVSSQSVDFEVGVPAQDVITDLTGGTVSSTLASISSSLTAVDGSSGTSAVDEVSALAAMATIDNSLSSLGYYASQLASRFDNVAPLGADALGGTVSPTLAALAATTATGVGGTGSNVTLLDTAVDSWLSGTKNNISTIAQLLNAMNTLIDTTKPLLAIAG
jgi:hypothetical protein